MQSRLLVIPLLVASVLSPTFATAQTTENPFEFHAALNAGAGRSNGLPVLGIPNYGTFDYRNAMFQVRYKVADRDQFVVQVLNRRLGISPLQAGIPDMTMQWAFWQRKTDFGTFKVGRSPMPRGIFNEIRFVGTVLPFYRPSFEIYGEGRETVDGVVYTKRFGLGSGFSADFNGFAGSNEVRTQVVTASGNSIRAFRGNALRGGQGWLNLPFGETRVGAYFADYRIDSDTARGSRREHLLSAESKIVPRTTLRVEALRIYGTGPNQDRSSVSGEAVVNLTERFDVSTQYSETHNRIFQTAPNINVDVRATRDMAVGGTMRIGNGSLIRLEYHDVVGYAFDRFVPIVINTAGVPAIQPSRTSAYWLASFAVSF